jgi:sugar lactone lactonase YvrE
MWGAHRVVCFDPQTGTQVDQVDVPASQASACWFGGPDLDELYITSARTGLDDAALAKEPLAGGLFRARPGARGAAADEFAG